MKTDEKGEGGRGGGERNEGGGREGEGGDRRRGGVRSGRMGEGNGHASRSFLQSREWLLKIIRTVWWS